MTALVSPFEIVASELRTLGLTIRRRPGEYCINYPHGGEKTAQFADDLDQALEIGRAMASEAAQHHAAAKPDRRKWRRKRIAPKTHRRRKWAWAPRKQPEES